MSRTEVSTLLGQPSGPGEAKGPERDEDSSGQVSYCMFRTTTGGLIVSVVEFASPAEAKKALTQNLVKKRMEEDDAKVTEETGIGERSFYGLSNEGSTYVFLKGNKAVGIGVGGAGAPKTTAFKASLKASAIAVAAKL